MTRYALLLMLAGPVAAAPAAPPDAARDAERAEDVEVLRRILNRTLGLPDKASASLPNAVSFLDMNVPNSAYMSGRVLINEAYVDPVTAHAANGNKYLWTTVMNRASSVASAPFDGVYLPGHGVVYTLRVPEAWTLTLDPPAKAHWLAETCRKCHATEPVSRTDLEPGDKPALASDEWTRTRQELRGQPVPDAPKVVATLSREQVCDPGALANKVIAKLHGNVGHLRHLAAGEFVTVVVTFDGYAGSARHRIDLNAVAAPNTPAGRPGFTPDESRQLTLGDLHLKQGKAKEAVAAYEQGLARYKAAKFTGVAPSDLPPEKARLLVQEFQKGVRDAYAKLAQAHLVSGEADKAQAAVELARTFTADLEPRGGEPAGVAVPAKLLVSVPVADLAKTDGDPAAFRKAIRVETVGFPAADRQPKK